MADIKQLNVNGTVYDIKDETARAMIPTDDDIATAVAAYLEENPVQGGGSELELLFDITTEEEVSAINAVLEKPGYFSELHIAILANGTESNTANKPIFISVNRQTYNDGGCAFNGGQVITKGLYAHSKIDVIVGNDMAFYTTDCRRGRTTSISQACAQTALLSRAIELTSLGFGTQNGTGFYGADSRVLAYGRRIG